jgi:hypothetical protein
MRMTKEQIEERLNGLIDEIVDAERDAADAPPGRGRHLRDDARAIRERVMDTLMEIYIGWAIFNQTELANDDKRHQNTMAIGLAGRCDSAQVDRNGGRLPDMRGTGARKLWALSRSVAQVRERQTSALHLRRLLLNSDLQTGRATMPTSIKLNIPDDLVGWRKIQERAKNLYWLSRRNGKSENEALLAVLDDCYRDPDVE